jgi:hypothetical protein
MGTKGDQSGRPIPREEHATMAKRKPAPTATEVAATFDDAMALVYGTNPHDEPPTLADLPIDDEVAEDNAKKNSVVKTAYKKRYAERAAAAGGGKVAQRSCWDWLAQELASECLDGSKISIARFLAVLDANGVDHSRWQNRSKGWEGRLRMTGRLALQKVVAVQGHLKTAEGAALDAPADWIAKHTH